ncbi:GIP, partial [Symbiodinium microadriaticum]
VLCVETSPEPRVLELLRRLVAMEWVQVSGLVAVVEELVAQQKENGELPRSFALLDLAAQSMPRAGELPRALASSSLLPILVASHAAVRAQYPALAQAAVPLLCAAAPRVPLRPRPPRQADSSSEAEAEIDEPLHEPAVVFEAVEDLLSASTSPDSLLPYALLPTFLPPETGLGVRHHGMLLAGAGGVLEEWDLDAGLRLDRLFASGGEEPGAFHVVSLMAPGFSATQGAPHEVLVAGVNGPDAGLALFRRTD